MARLSIPQFAPRAMIPVSDSSDTSLIIPAAIGVMVVATGVMYYLQQKRLEAAEAALPAVVANSSALV